MELLGGSSLWGRRQKHVFEHNPAANYLTMKKLHMGRLDLKIAFLAILEFLILRYLKKGKCRISKNSDFLT